MSMTQHENKDLKNVSGCSIEPWLTVSDSIRAVQFYKDGFGAIETYRLEGSENDLVARLAVGGAGFWVSNGPLEKAGSEAVRMILIVPDPDALFNRALKAGATLVFPVGEEHGWRLGRLSDPFGFQWEIGRMLNE